MKFDIWKECPKVPLPSVLLTVVDNRGKTVPTAPSGHKLIATNCVRNENLYPVYEKIRYLSEETYRTWFRAHPEPGDIIFVCKGTPGRVCLVPDPIDFCIAQDMVALRADPKIVYNKYLLAVLRSFQIQEQILSTSVGDVIPHFKKSFFDQIMIPIPNMDIQKSIGDFYYTISEKTELNKKINDNLHQQAATLFKALFVDLAPFDGTMPPNWTISTLGDATEMGAGGDKPKESSPVKTPLCPYPIYSNGINDYGLYGYTNEPKIKVESVTVSARGTIGYVCLRHTPYVPIVRLVTLIPDTKVLSAKYLYLYLRQLHITGTGTTQQQLTVPDFRKTEIIIPDKNTMDSFTETVTPLFEQIWANEDENTKLAEVRDALLPKLMSGEIDVF